MWSDLNQRRSQRTLTLVNRLAHRDTGLSLRRDGFVDIDDAATLVMHDRVIVFVLTHLNFFVFDFFQVLPILEDYEPDALSQDQSNNDRAEADHLCGIVDSRVYQSSEFLIDVHLHAGTSIQFHQTD